MFEKKHFKWFVKYDYDEVLFRQKIDPHNCPLKRFTDLIVFTFILQYIPLEQLENVCDIYVLSERFFNNSGWRKRTGCEYKDFWFFITSYQVLWRK